MKKTVDEILEKFEEVDFKNSKGKILSDIYTRLLGIKIRGGGNSRVYDSKKIIGLIDEYFK
jgi:hypothetical protein